MNTVLVGIAFMVLAVHMSKSQVDVKNYIDDAMSKPQVNVKNYVDDAVSKPQVNVKNYVDDAVSKPQVDVKNYVDDAVSKPQGDVKNYVDDAVSKPQVDVKNYVDDAVSKDADNYVDNEAIKPQVDVNNYDSNNDECKGKIDIVFLIDNSWSVLKPNFDKLKDFVSTTAYDLRPLSQDHVLIGVDVFSKKAITEISLKDCNDFWSFRQAVSQIPFQGGPTNTHCALENALWNSFSEEFGGRPNVPKLAIIFTDGKSQDKKATWKAAYRLKDSGVNVVAIGIGPHIDEEELVTISSDGNPYKLPNFGSLEHPSFRTSIYGVIHKIKSAICYSESQYN